MMSCPRAGCGKSARPVRSAGDGNEVTVELLGHRHAKATATDKQHLQPPRHLSTLPVSSCLTHLATAEQLQDMNLWNWAEAEKEFKRGIELSPNYATGHKWYGNLLMALGRLDEALIESKRALDLEPQRGELAFEAIEHHSRGGRHAGASD